MTELEALISLLDDEDNSVAVTAMEKLLDNEEFITVHMPRLQESDNPLVRERIHQMESIIVQKEKKENFLLNLDKDDLSLIDGLFFMNQFFYDDLCISSITKRFSKIAAELSKKDCNSLDVVNYMRQENYTFPKTDVLDIDYFLLDDALENKIAHSVLLCMIAREIADRLGIALVVVLYKGRHCLIDTKNHFIDPMKNWKVETLEDTIKVYPCTNRDLLLTVLSQLYLSCMVDGQLKVIYQLTEMMSFLTGKPLEDMPFPIGHVDNSDEETNNDTGSPTE